MPSIGGAPNPGSPSRPSRKRTKGISSRKPIFLSRRAVGPSWSIIKLILHYASNNILTNPVRNILSPTLKFILNKINAPKN
jgi:hypothetical protein